MTQKEENLLKQLQNSQTSAKETEKKESSKPISSVEFKVAP